jgi:hypothetical protein
VEQEAHANEKEEEMLLINDIWVQGHAK